MSAGTKVGQRSLKAGTIRQRAASARERIERVRDPTELLFAVAVVASGTFLLVLGSRMTFLFDDWTFLINRPGWSADALLNPHNEHIAFIPVTIYKALLEVFGMSSAFPFRVVSTALFLTSAVLLFVYLRRRIDQWLALGATVVVLFLGGAFEDLLWSFQMGFFGSMAAGLGMLLALERRDRFGDGLACLLLAISIGFSSLGLPFAAGAAVEVASRRDRWQRSYVVAIPALLFALWWLGWGHTAENALSLHNFGLMPAFVANAIAIGLASMVGLSTPTPEALAPDWSIVALDWGRPLLVLTAVLAGWRLYRLGTVPRWLWVVAAIGFSFWILAALNAMPGRTAGASRYVYMSVIFIVLIAAELLRGVRIGRRGIAVLAVAGVAILASNITFLHDQYKNFRTVGDIERADLGALEITRDHVKPEFLVSEEIGDLPFALTNAGPYFDAADEFGSPALSPREIASAPDQARVAADKVLAAALELRLEPAPGSPQTAGPPPVLKGPPEALLAQDERCITVRVTHRNAPLLEVPPGGVLLRSEDSGEARVRLRRFAQQSIPVDLGTLAPGETELLAIPADRSSVPWKLSLQGTRPVSVCGLGA